VSRNGKDTPASAAIHSIKADLRKQVLARRDALGETERKSLSERITARLLALDAFRAAGCVMAYVGFGSEIDTTRFVAETLSRGKTLVLPRVERGNRSLKLHAVRDPENQLEAGVWGIRQPRADLCPEIFAAQVEFVLVPGVAFTRRCERLGYGGGFYDRFIGGLAPRPALVVAAFALQVLPALPTSKTDRRVDLVMTEDAEYRAQGGNK
jgi:5-formyltetrahydrofolate cyclo-ligase